MPQQNLFASSHQCFGEILCQQERDKRHGWIWFTKYPDAFEARSAHSTFDENQSLHLLTVTKCIDRRDGPAPVMPDYVYFLETERACEQMHILCDTRKIVAT